MNGESGDDEIPNAIVPTITSVRDNIADYAVSDEYNSVEATPQRSRRHDRGLCMQKKHHELHPVRSGTTIGIPTAMMDEG